MRTTFKFAALVLLASGVTAAADDTGGGMKDGTAAAASPNWDIAFGGYTASDYIFRGITQSAHDPSVSSYSELRYNALKDVQLYAGTSIESIDYPNRAAAEVDFYGGVRPTFGKLALDFGYWYYWYPGGREFNGDLSPLPGPNASCTNGFKTPTGFCNIYEADLSFWEVYGKATYTVNDTITLGANVFYSPSWLSEGADGLWALGSVKLTAPSSWIPAVVPKGTGAFFLGEAGHYWFGQTNAFYGNIDLPDYTEWDLGVTFTYKVFSLDFRYYDTDLSRADCNVLTSDHTASYSPSNISSINPSGLGSNWCGASFVVKASFDLTADTNLK
ncbi:MAG: TorF family putative porin [Rhodomicrobium sp.]